MLEKLSVIFGESNAVGIHSKVKNLLTQYKGKIKESDHVLTQKDIVLITYGDQVQKDGQSHLKTFYEFYNDRLSGFVNSVHFLPFFPYSSDDGFSVIDFKKIDPDLGDWNDVNLIHNECRLMFDAVVNHISSQSDWFKEYLQGKPEYANYFHNIPADTDLTQVVRPRMHPLLTPFDRNGEQVNIWTTFSEDQIDLNFSDPELFLEMVDVLLFYLSQGASLLRLDAIAFLWKEIGTDCLHHEKTHLYVKLFKDILTEVKKDTLIITETNVPHNENISYFGNGSDEADLVYNFSLPPLLAHAILKGDTSILTNWAQTLSLPSKEVCFFNFTASHDGIGVRPATGILPDEDITFLAETAIKNGGAVSYKTNSDGSKSPYELNCNYLELITNSTEPIELRKNKFICSQSVLITMPGVPGIYFHSLVGSLNSHTEVEKTGRARSINREKLQIGNLNKDLEDQNSLGNAVFNEYQSMLEKRILEPAFDPYGEFEVINCGDKLFCILRKAKNSNESIFAIHNLSNEKLTLDNALFNDFNYDILSNQTITPSIEPYSFYWLKQKNS